MTGVPMSYLLSRGQSIKVFSQILRKSRTKGLVVPNMKVRASCGGCVGGGAVSEGGCGRAPGADGRSAMHASSSCRRPAPPLRAPAASPEPHPPAPAPPR